MTNNEKIKQSVQRSFVEAAQDFYTQTHGVIDICQGKDELSQLGARDFLPTAKLYLKEFSNAAPSKSSEAQAKHIYTALRTNLTDAAQRSYLERNEDAYKNALAHAIETTHEPRPQKARSLFHSYTMPFESP